MKKTASALLEKDIILILTASFFYMACPMMVTPLITGFSASLGSSGTLMGIIGGLMNLCSLFFRPIAGRMTDRTSKYVLACSGSGFMILACLGYSIAGKTEIVFVARIIHGLGFSLCSVCLSTWMAQLLPKDKIGSGMGFYGTANALSMAIAPALGIQIQQWFGYRTAFFCAMICSVLTLLLVQFVKRRGEFSSCVGDSQKFSLSQIIAPNIIPVSLIVMLFGIPFCATQSFLVNYINARGIAVSSSLFFPVYAASLLILRLSLSKLFDSVKMHWFVFFGCMSALIAMFLLTIMHSNITLILAAIFMSAGYGIICSVAQANALLRAGKGRQGIANSTYYIGMDLGMTLGPLFGGILFEQIPICNFYLVLMFCPVLCLCFQALLLISSHHKSS